MIKRILFVLFGLMLTYQGSASHLLGGEIWWKCITTGPNAGKYHFYLRLYRECAGIPMPTGNQTISGGPGSISVSMLTDASDPFYVPGGFPRDASPQASALCPASGKITCNPPPSTPQTGAMQEAIWRTPNPVTLSGIPPAAGWTFSWTDCCRPATSNLSGQPSYYLRAVMFPYNDGTGPKNANPCYDSSPSFLESPKVVTCTGYEFAYNNFAYDENLDSLHFDWAQPLISATGSAPFVAPYTFNNPVPGIVSFAQDAGQVNINSTATGTYVTCMKVTAYKFGQKVAEIYRDIPVILISCPSSTNDPPSLAVIQNPDPDAPQLDPIVVGGDTLFWETTVEAGELLKFGMQSYDSDYLPGFIPQTIKFIAVGGNLGTPYTSTTNCLFTAPCATVTPTFGQVGYESFFTNNVEFSWQTHCDHLSYSTSAGGSLRNQYLFYFKMEDNACPAPYFSMISLIVNVVSTSPVPPSLDCVTPVGNDVQLDFTPPADIDTGQKFGYYVVFRGGNNGIFTAIDTIWNYSQSTYTDNNPMTGTNYYYMRSYGACDQESLSSDTITWINLSLTSLPPAPAVPNTAVLSWNNPKFGSPMDTLFEVLRRPAGGTIWTMIASTSQLTYTDVVTFCEEELEYGVRVAGLCPSNKVGDLYADKENTDVLDIEYVTVDNGQAQLEWPPTTSPDVLEYIILQLIGGSWIEVDRVPVGTPTPYTVPTSNADVESESYKVVSIDTCGNQSSDLLVDAHSTIHLRANLDACAGGIIMNWNAYGGWPVSGYVVLADITPQGGPTQTNVVLDSLGPGARSLKHDPAVSNADYCIRVVATDATGNVMSTSNVNCANSSELNTSDFQYMARATVRVDGSVETWTFIDPDADVEKYEVQRAEDTLGPWLTLATFSKPITAPYYFKYRDFSAQPDAVRYIYRLRSSNSCGGVDMISNYGTNLLIEVTPNENLMNRITWNPYRDYAGEVSRYEVYRRAENEAQWTLVTADVTDTVYYDNIRPFGTDQDPFCYRIAAVEGPNPDGYVAEDGGPIRSYSNVACGEQAVRGFFPTAFNPESKIEENRVWKPVNAFEDPDNYTLQIYNRWGEKVFESNDPDEGWDGTYGSEPSPMGVYMYSARFRAKGGKMEERRGTFTLIR